MNNRGQIIQLPPPIKRFLFTAGNLFLRCHRYHAPHTTNIVTERLLNLRYMEHGTRYWFVLLRHFLCGCPVLLVGTYSFTAEIAEFHIVDFLNPGIRIIFHIYTLSFTGPEPLSSIKLNGGFSVRVSDFNVKFQVIAFFPDR